MPLAVAAGQCWKTLAGTIPGYRPIAASDILHLGARDLDPGEAALLNQRAVTVITASELQSSGAKPALSVALDRLVSRPVYLHIDLDVLDPTLAPTNEYYAPSGLTPDELVELVTLLHTRTQVSALCFASYDPAYDPQGKTIQAGLKLADLFFSALS